ncbi:MULTISPECIES: RnfABCDGE type electron transport complex subunit B [unclassified Rhodanobacter]|uniref:RnfABCDGE type electron transport complex subunit B n=1 Tax=unclassified Rhodanobacter TaxID=2621553 RepID=UPI001BDF4058|nr:MULTISPECIES: RnfABCDGE type electron transport complex subunit B [unclassified Rhodanobacter]MBT2142883.1 RnfABCDGE type electron transport complex subunit B [Rhodanobacter sp. LX-99]MBT2148044.1 RnfABCDGE type electron transport complex subunit B [Rhodanobacter sp. LX-100]
MSDPITVLADRIDAVLPQTQCEQCGYHGCRPYAEAIARGEAEINQCPPGGAAGIEKLAALLQRPVLPLDPAHGVEKPRTLARIVEADCIGCTKCIQACPVDAIVGASKLMHTVLADDCTGCELCVPACPVDCIVLEPMPPAQIDAVHADAARAHFQRREARLQHQRDEREAELAARKAAVDTAAGPVNPVLAALARARAKQQEPKP